MELSAIAGLAVCVGLLLWTVRHYERSEDRLRQENARLRIQLARADETREAVIEAYQQAQLRHPCNSHWMRLVDGGAR